MHEIKPQRKGRWSKCNLFNMACSLFSEKRKQFSTDKINYSHGTLRPGTKLFFTCQDSKQVVEMGLRGSVVLWSVFSLFKISTVACLFPSMTMERSSSLDRKLCGLGTPLTALKQEALGDGLIIFRSLNKCLLGQLPHSCARLWTITSWAEQAIQLRLYKGQEKSTKDWGLDSGLDGGKSMYSIVTNNDHQIFNNFD